MMKRRHFLISAAATGTFAACPPAMAFMGNKPVPVTVIITGISSETDVAKLGLVVSRLAQQGVGVTCVLDTGQSDGIDPNLVAVIETLSEIGGSIDLGLHVARLNKKTAYFQSRSVYEARKKLKRAVGKRNLPYLLDTVATEDVERPREPVGIQASGIHNILNLPAADGPVRSEAWAAKVARYSGGQKITPYRNLVVKPETITGQERLFFYLAADALATVSSDWIRDWAADTAVVLSRLESSGIAALMSVSDLQLRDSFTQERLITVMVEMGADAGSSETKTATEFQAELARTGIPSILKPQGESYWVGLSDADRKLTSVSVNCTERSWIRLEAEQPLGLGHNIRLVEAVENDFGLDECATLRIPFTKFGVDDAFANGFQSPVRIADKALVVPSSILERPAWRRKILSDLSDVGHDGLTRFARIDELVGRSLAHGHADTRHRLTRAKSPQIAPPRMRAVEDEAWLHDARIAWSYIEKNTERVTGLCPATVNLRAGGDTHRSVTMWDVGSNINAIASAALIGLIPKDEARTRLKKILPNIVGRRTDGRLLPQGWIRTDRLKWGIRDFDGCDAGRLLAALDFFRRRIGLKDELESHVASWDFDKVIVEGHLQSVIARKFVSTFKSHCAHYITRAFERWGYKIDTPYKSFGDMAPGDAEMALLETVSAIGPLGAEPLLLEAMELGMSEESAYLAEVLLRAQEEEYDASGRLVCMSETPIDRAPWFIYQGLQLNAGPRSWRLDTVGHQPEYLTAEAAEEFMAFSVKAAFLWAAYRPGDFTDKLLDFARKNGRAEGAFTSSVNIRTQQPTQGYSDLNTNSVILQAISYRLAKEGWEPGN